MEAEIPEKYLEEMKEESQKRGREQYLSSNIQGSVNLILNSGKTLIVHSPAPTKTQILRAIRDSEDAEAQRTQSLSSHSEAMFIDNAIDLADLQ